MKYIYYIIGILIFITLAMSMRFISNLKVEVSEPALVVNERILSKSEIDEYSKAGSYHSRGEGRWHAIITNELMIQEAIKLNLNKEETFRKSVESFYEQSLVKALIDYKLQTLSPEVTADMISKYKEMYNKTVKYTKSVYENEEAIEKGEPQSVISREYVFKDLSETLQFSLFKLVPGESTLPELSNDGYVVYRFDGISDASDLGVLDDDDDIRDYLIDQSRNAMFAEWLNDLKKEATIEILIDE